MTETRQLPDLDDMMNAGMGLTQALALWGRMMNDPVRDPEIWWQKINPPKARH